MNTPKPSELVATPDWATRVAGIFVLVFGVLPIVNWVPGGREAGWYTGVASQWFTGSLIALGAGIVGAILFRERGLPLGWWHRMATGAVLAPGLTGLLLAVVSGALYAVVAVTVFAGSPLHLDEVAQVIQARIFASGRLYLPAPAAPEFQSVLHVLDDGGKWFSQFPPGGPLLLVPGVLAGATWVVGPIAGALSVALFWGITRRLAAPQTALAAAILFAVAPFVVMMSASHMNHSGAMLWVLCASYGAVRLHDDPAAVRWGLILGLALGMLVATRPVDGLAFGLPLGVWMSSRTLRGRQTLAVWLASGVGVAIPASVLLWYNHMTTGSVFLFAYEKLWGPEHGLGFHQPPWGDAHTPARGLELISLYFLRLQTYLFETPVPSLVFVGGALLLTRLKAAVERLWLSGAALLVVLYFSYWHDGFYLGPRFVYLLTPLCVWVVVRALAEMPRTVPTAGVRRGVWGTVIASVVMAAFINVPDRVGQYRRGLAIMREDPSEVAARAGVSNALVLVRESWGAQLVARLWALGVSRGATERLYNRVDTCVLDEAISALEHEQVRGDSAFRRLRGLMADSARLQASPWSPDGSQRVLPGRAYGPVCQQRLAEDRLGFTVMTAVLVRDWGSNVYARDLHARDSLLLQAHPERALYVLRTQGSEIGAPLTLVPVSRDSVVASWK